MAINWDLFWIFDMSIYFLVNDWICGFITETYRGMTSLYYTMQTRYPLSNKCIHNIQTLELPAQEDPSYALDCSSYFLNTEWDLPFTKKDYIFNYIANSSPSKPTHTNRNHRSILNVKLAYSTSENKHKRLLSCIKLHLIIVTTP